MCDQRAPETTALTRSPWTSASSTRSAAPHALLTAANAGVRVHAAALVQVVPSGRGDASSRRSLRQGSSGVASPPAATALLRVRPNPAARGRSNQCAKTAPLPRSRSLTRRACSSSDAGVWRSRSARPRLSENGSGGSLVFWNRPCRPRRRPGSCRRMPGRCGRIEALVALVAQRRQDGLCGALPDEDTRPEAVAPRHEPSGLGVAGAACGELAVLW